MTNAAGETTNPPEGGHPRGGAKIDAEPSQPAPPAANLRRAVGFMTVSSFLVPLAGLLTQPLFARALGVDGRGELQAALAPAALATAVATLGLPDALTYFTARNPRITRVALAWAGTLSLLVGVVCLAVVWGLLPWLSKGDAQLGEYILVGMVLAIPLLAVGALRGAAMGHQLWRRVALESFVNITLRVGSLVVLFVMGHLTPLAAVVVTSVTPLLAGLVYLPLLRSSAHHPEATEEQPNGVLRPLLSFGARVWFGSVASMLLSRVSQVLMVPLSSTYDLGLYAVASTISDLPLLVALAVAGALMGVNARSNDPVQVATTTRLGVLLGAVGCGGLAVTLPFWIVPLFTEQFAAALIPTLMLIASALICVPGLMTGASLSAFGRPGLRSTGLVVTVVVNVTAFVTLVPLLGVYGACWTSIISNVVLTSWNVIAASKVMGLPPTMFLVPRGSDVSLAWTEGLRLVNRVLPGRRAAA
ncbi:Membrane protein involved in the export of O-antigen and teichoic acid [Quadrisphaera granulorum]|uniref:O-antigen/teichoic acid export membrane protein n=1 Tax=Quadrisphaera granulorum TaxID=317664 RepID=A0A316ABP1_9ACTN|nr:oligosaccharide flippase family protein [Quadrisphaera granulorum]PWJ55123.1 O-antigen/teichoic acid export membrane protein [Quadrisphaera granulorum]SZE95632.1 Membrane protein involved in the export of O-antigen and teichoic acid [Quadrisphaera granulorum]